MGVLEEMESRKNIPNFSMLANLILVREELRLIEQDSSHFALHNLLIDLTQQKVPNEEMIFLKELISMNDSSKRIAILKKNLSNKNTLSHFYAFETYRVKTKSNNKYYF